MYEYNVLSNYDLIKITCYVICGMPFLAMFAYYLAKRDAITFKQVKKSLFRKVAPWGVLCVFLSELTLLMIRLTYYPWSMTPQPSQASIFREIRYNSEQFVFWGWANDDQLPVLTALTGTTLWLFWTFYAFHYLSSNIPLWKKVCKVIVYIIISIVILGFNVHTLTDFVWISIILFIVFVLLKLSHSKRAEKQTLPRPDITTEQENTEVNNKSEDDTQFMPKALETKQVKEEKQSGEQLTSIVTDMVEIAKIKPKTEKPFVEVAEGTDNDHNEVRDTDSSATKTDIEQMMYCKYCGKKIEADSLFCKYCGRKL